jgi:uncharacterized membrane protein YbhN (UPF0104 family)
LNVETTNTDAVAGSQPPEATKKSPVRRIVSIVFSLVLVAAIFIYAIPKFADYSSVWSTITSLTPLELGSLVLATVFNLFTYWLANMAALPGLRLGHAAVLTQTTTTVANTVPAGGAIAVGLTYTILHSWGFTGTDVALYVGVTGIWNIFIKLALPIISLGWLVIAGRTTPQLVTAALIGLAVLAVAVGLLAGLFSSEHLARRIGAFGGRVISWFRKLLRKPPLTDADERAAQFRKDTIGLVRRRWLPLTVATLLSHFALFFVLLLSLRHVGVSEQEISTAEVFAVFAFGRLITALPFTPGGLGFVELGYIGGLTAFAPTDEMNAQIVAAVLLFRLLTYGIQIPIGAGTYLFWRANTGWRKPQPTDSSLPGDPRPQEVPS